MSLRKLDMVCKKLDDESAASLRELYGFVMQCNDIHCWANGKTRSGHDVKLDVMGLARRDGKLTRMLVELNYQ